MAKEQLDIAPPDTYSTQEMLVELSDIPPVVRFDEVIVPMKVDDLMLLLVLAIDQSLGYEQTVGIVSNRTPTDKESLERARVDDRMERMISALEQVGIKRTVIAQMVWHRRQEMLESLKAFNEVLTSS